MAQDKVMKRGAADDDTTVAGTQSAVAGGAPVPPPLPAAAGAAPADRAFPAEPSPTGSDDPDTASTGQQRRVARRRPAGPVRNRIAANDDAPSIGGLIFALEQQPSTRPFTYAAIASVVWGIVGLGYGVMQVSGELSAGASLLEALTRPTSFMIVGAVVVPITVLWFLALLAWRSEELRLRSSTMTEVAIRLAEPDRMAEQSIASLGQAVRRQVSFMNDAVSRALGRAGELEALVHSEVAALERSYEENERRIRSLIQELSGERHALVNTSVDVSETLKNLGSEVPALIDKLSNQQIKLAQIIQGAGDNLTALETAIGSTTLQLQSTVGTSTAQLEGSVTRASEYLESSVNRASDRLESVLGSNATRVEGVLESYTMALGDALTSRTDGMQTMLESYTIALGDTLTSRTDGMQTMLESYTSALADALANRTDNLQAVFEEYTRALDSSLASRAHTLDAQLIERTKELDSAFSERLRLFDQSITRSTQAIDQAVAQNQLALTGALERHAQNFNETVNKQSLHIDEALMHGINSVRRSSENITRQSLKAIEGLANQSEMLRSVSENLLGQIQSVTGRFDNQTAQIMRAANSLESANYKIDQTLQTRHSELSHTLDRLSGKADEFGRFIEGYSTSLERSLGEAELRARTLADELRTGTEVRKQAAIDELTRLKATADAESERALADLRARFSTVSSEVTQQLGSLTTRFDETSEEVRQRAARTAAELAEEQARLRRELERLPNATRESADAMRRALGDQLKALEQLSVFTSRTATHRDVTPPMGAQAGPVPGFAPGSGQTGVAPGNGRVITSLSSTLAQELNALQQRREGPAGGSVQAQPSVVGGDPAQSWSLGDLLKRASSDDDHGASALSAGGAPPMAGPTVSNAVISGVPAPLVAQSQPFQLNVDVIARALDPATAAAIWSRFRVGQRGIMVRSIYTAEGRATFDEVSRRYKTDADLKATIDRYLAEFEHILRETEVRDPSGQLLQGHVVSDMGRVYLFLAHATGRLV